MVTVVSNTGRNLSVWKMFNLLKVRPHGQKFSRKTWYNMVVRHKTCRGRGSVDGMGDVYRATFYVVQPRS